MSRVKPRAGSKLSERLALDASVWPIRKQEKLVDRLATIVNDDVTKFKMRRLPPGKSRVWNHDAEDHVFEVSYADSARRVGKVEYFAEEDAFGDAESGVYLRYF